MAEDHLHGRFLLSAECTFEELDTHFESGASIKTTRLTDEFDFEAFQCQHGESAMPLFLVTDAGKLVVATEDKNVAPQAGQKLVALIDSPADAVAGESDSSASDAANAAES